MIDDVKDTILHAIYKDKRSESDAQTSPAYAKQPKWSFWIGQKASRDYTHLN